MISQVAGLASDPALPHRDVLLDADAMRVRLSHLLPHSLGVRTCDAVRVNYQVGKSLRVLFALEAGGARQFVAARMFRDGRSAEAFRRAAADASRPPTLDVVHDGEIDSVCWVFPADRKIASLPLLMKPPDDLARTLDGSWVGSRVVAYAPEKSATAACVDADGVVTAYAKVSAAEQTARDFGFYRSLRTALAETDPCLAIPAPLAFSSHLRILLLEAMRGRRVGEESDWADDLSLMGAALARFHRCSVPDAPPFTRFHPERLEMAAQILARVRPDVEGAATGLARRLIAAQPSTSDVVCLHGDVHPKNAIVDGDRVSLLDVEDLAIGPAAADIGSMLASLLYLHVGDCLSDDAYAMRASAFLTGYARVRRMPDRAALAWHVAAALFIERAVRAVTRVRPVGLSHLPALLERADYILGGLDA
jgi:Ser/Thr protein kinase RdoA (MazF antagonist)